MRELGNEPGRQAPLQLVLEDGPTDSDPPDLTRSDQITAGKHGGYVRSAYLGEVAKESKQSQGGRVGGDRERSENGEEGRSVQNSESRAGYCLESNGPCVGALGAECAQQAHADHHKTPREPYLRAVLLALRDSDASDHRHGRQTEGKPKHVDT